MASADDAKQLKILVGCCKRVKKELVYYEKDVVKQKAKVEKMKADGKDASDIKQQEEVLAETQAMVPDTQSRLEEYYAKLEECLAVVKENGDGPTELVQEAESLLNRATEDRGANAVGSGFISMVCPSTSP
eukprot:CAMPEP_0119132714 /NCGR_PEP_ID=MMETSP1310-20130426/12177_1 /TAXON_ID=464262 /ORGANISM="Genus nov. species nov., Strain RCC2339" /LENGTH=130 /DNA_ID=CAMNT_0007123365 /DNA_START=81 /DNA_END=471 /DNA_ORIENTATION=+